jgi:hypothetical protein
MALGIQHKKGIHQIVICSLPCSTIFFQISHKLHDFREKDSENKIYVWIPSSPLVWHIFRSKEN